MLHLAASRGPAGTPRRPILCSRLAHGRVEAPDRARVFLACSHLSRGDGHSLASSAGQEIAATPAEQKQQHEDQDDPPNSPHSLTLPLAKPGRLRPETIPVPSLAATTSLAHFLRDVVENTERKKKPTCSKTLRHSNTSVYSSTGPPAGPGCPLSSHPTTSLFSIVRLGTGKANMIPPRRVLRRLLSNCARSRQVAGERPPESELPLRTRRAICRGVL